MLVFTSALLLTASLVGSWPGPVSPALTGSAGLTASSPTATGQAPRPSQGRSGPLISVSPRSPPVVTDPVVPPDAASQGEAPLPEQGAQNDIVVTGRRKTAGDPLRAMNAEAFGVTRKFDGAVVGPVARTYKKTVPGPIRQGIHNFLYNLREPIVFLNFLLQLKPGKAAETVGRFAINTTIGAVGVVDMAKRKPFRLPRRSNGFANTLGYYGVRNGPFLFLPLVGPTTVRDLFGGAIDRLILPAAVGNPFTSTTYTVPAAILGTLDHRSEFDQTLKDLHDNSPDPYAATRAFYLNRRQAEIDRLHGHGQDDPAGMSEAPASVRPFVPKELEPSVRRPASPGVPRADTPAPDAEPMVKPPSAAAIGAEPRSPPERATGIGATLDRSSATDPS